MFTVKTAAFGKIILRRIFESELLFRYIKMGEIEIARAIINIVCD